jgi:hypothetical protein
MSKMGLAAAELDQRLSAVNLAGLTFSNEEDKQYLSNIANMEGGTYKVTLEDGTKKELSDLKQDEFNKLLEQQKTGPKTLEEIASKQLSIDESILFNVRGMNTALSQGFRGNARRSGSGHIFLPEPSGSYGIGRLSACRRFSLTQGTSG